MKVLFSRCMEQNNGGLEGLVCQNRTSDSGSNPLTSHGNLSGDLGLITNSQANLTLIMW